MRFWKFVVIAAVALVFTSTLQAQTTAFVGTWKLNLTKSKYHPGPAPKSLTRTIEADGDGLKYKFEGVAADDKPIAFTFSVHFDGKDNPISGMGPGGADTISAKRKDATHYVATLKKGDKLLTTAKVSISADGKVSTVDSTGTSAAGMKTHDVQVYDKQ